MLHCFSAGFRYLSGGTNIIYSTMEHNDTERDISEGLPGEYRHQKTEISALGFQPSKQRSQNMRLRDSVLLHKEKTPDKLQKEEKPDPNDDEIDQKDNRSVTFNERWLTLKDREAEVNEFEIPKSILKPPQSRDEKEVENKQSQSNYEENPITEHKSALEKITKPTRTDRALDIIIYGATGALGSYTVLEAVNVLKKHKWGIAGRCNDKLRSVLQNVSILTNVACQNIPTFIADANDMTALIELVQQCQILINCCGPYEEYAPSIVHACITAGTHYVDANMDPRLLKQFHSQFHAEAQCEKIYVITSCGFVSFVIDMGMNYIERNFSGTLNTVEAYSQYCRLSTRYFVPVLNSSTWNCAITALANAYDLDSGCIIQNAAAALAAFQQNVASNRINALVNAIIQLGSMTSSYQFPIARTEAINGVSIPLPLVDVHVVKASQEFISKNEKKPPVEFKNHLTFRSYFLAFFALIWCLVLFILAQFPVTRKLLLSFPRLFSLGICTTDCIDKDSANELFFAITLKGTGFYTRAASNRDELRPAVCGPSPTQSQKSLKASEKVVNVKICGINPFFGIGCVALLSSAITILKGTNFLCFALGVVFLRLALLFETHKFWRKPGSIIRVSSTLKDVYSIAGYNIFKVAVAQKSLEE